MSPSEKEFVKGSLMQILDEEREEDVVAPVLTTCCVISLDCSIVAFTEADEHMIWPALRDYVVQSANADKGTKKRVLKILGGLHRSFPLSVFLNIDRLVGDLLLPMLQEEDFILNVACLEALFRMPEMILDNQEMVLPVLKAFEAVGRAKLLGEDHPILDDIIIYALKVAQNSSTAIEQSCIQVFSCLFCFAKGRLSQHISDIKQVLQRGLHIHALKITAFEGICSYFFNVRIFDEALMTDLFDAFTSGMTEVDPSFIFRAFNAVVPVVKNFFHLFKDYEDQLTKLSVLAITTPQITGEVKLLAMNILISVPNLSFHPSVARVVIPHYLELLKESHHEYFNQSVAQKFSVMLRRSRSTFSDGCDSS